MIKHLYPLLFSCFLVFSGIAQEREITRDSLKELDEFLNEALDRYDYTTTIDRSGDLINLASRLNDTAYLYRGYRILGVTYQNLDDMLRAKENYEKALEYALQTENDTLLMGAYNNLGNVYSEDKETIEKGLEFYDRSIEYGNKIENYPQILTPILNKGWTHLDNQQYEKAYPYLLRAQALMGEVQEGIAYSQLMTLFGKYYSGVDSMEKARGFFEMSLQIAEKDSLIIAASFANKEYGKMLYKDGDYKRAYEINEKHQEYQARIFREEKLHQMEAAYARFGMEESRKELELAKREQVYKDNVIAKTRQFSLILVFSVVIMLFFLFLLFRNNRTRNKLIEQLREKNEEFLMAKEKAERLSSLKTRFLSTVSHELRTPLYGVVGLTSLLLEDNRDKKQVEDLTSLKFSADYLLALINDVLQMNKMESDLIHLENTPFNLRDLMHSIVKSFEFSRKENNNVIELEVSEKIPPVIIGDSVRLSQVIMNLVGNAVKFTENGKVWIDVETEKCEGETCVIYFEIGDNGVGIPADKQEEIFEEFSQLRSNNFSYQGTGLGLPIVKKLLHLFGSKVELQSVEGQGSVFSFSIAFQVGKAIDHQSLGPGNEVPVKMIKKALIVDDNRINQIVTQRILEKREFDCKAVSGGYEAINILKDEDFDLVLMDVNMPEIDGLDTTRKIREFNKEIPIIALTAVELDEMREKILASGMNDIIVKPYDVHQFFHTINKNLLLTAV